MFFLPLTGWLTPGWSIFPLLHSLTLSHFTAALLFLLPSKAGPLQLDLKRIFSSARGSRGGRAAAHFS